LPTTTASCKPPLPPLRGGAVEASVLAGDQTVAGGEVEEGVGVAVEAGEEEGEGEDRR